MEECCKIIKLSFAEAKERIDRDKNIRIVDVREENEFATGHLENALNLPLTELVDVSEKEGQEFAESLLPDKEKPVMVYCRTGKRSTVGAETLKKFGYREIYDMGGLATWPYGLVYD